MDDYEETPEEREAGRKFMRDAQAMVEALMATQSPKEQEAIVKSFTKEQTNG